MSADIPRDAESPWLHSPLVDSLFVLAPPFLAVLAALVFGVGWGWEMGAGGFLLLVVCVDVAHVYATIFRTYLDFDELRRRPLLYTLAPVLSYAGFVLVFAGGWSLFWRCLAYFAAFHFVRQCYGLMRLYGRGETWAVGRRIDAFAIYGVTLFPLLYWHAVGRAFPWFVEGDFLAFESPGLARFALAGFWASLLGFVGKEALAPRGMRRNLPKTLIVLGSAAAWGVGILAFDRDAVFTITNIVAHGVPYLALVWIVASKQAARSERAELLGRFSARSFFRKRYIPLYLLVLITLGYLEEAIWDGLLWDAYPSLFPLASPLLGSLGDVDDVGVARWIMPLLALPQVTHYVLDGFLWRSKSLPTPASSASEAVQLVPG
ncbi:MAG TPA: hypothetical protein VLC09_07735 [Polyangiaceae bacterium]|nr:hypothetical protein [Polyangiaceae bacterium]